MTDRISTKIKQIAISCALAVALCIVAIPTDAFGITIGTPSITKLSPTSSSVTVTWSKASNASGYQVYRGTTKVGSTTSLSYQNSGLEASTKYTYKVRAYKKSTVSTKYYYNSKTKKWQTTKPAAGSWVGKKTKYVKTTKYTYGKYSTAKSCTTKAAPVTIRTAAPKADEKVLAAFETLGFKFKIDPNASFTGIFSATDHNIVLKRNDDNVYHELGHFVSFVAGNTDTSSAFKAVYDAEKGLYDGRNPGYVLQSSSEYFAESYRDYVLHKTSLKTTRPQTYAAIETALSRITDEQVARIARVYGSLWR